jgi:hypothetical protein
MADSYFAQRILFDPEGLPIVRTGFHVQRLIQVISRVNLHSAMRRISPIRREGRGASERKCKYASTFVPTRCDCLPSLQNDERHVVTLRLVAGVDTDCCNNLLNNLVWGGGTIVPDDRLEPFFPELLEIGVHSFGNAIR